MFDLKSIQKGQQVRAPRIILLGTEKVGKSTFAAGSENPIFLPIKGEEGIDAFDCARFPAAENFGNVVEALKTLSVEDHDYKTIVIDSTSALEPLVWAEVCRLHGEESIEKVMGGFGKGYIEAVNAVWSQIRRALDWLRDNKNMTSIMIGHVNIRTVEDPDADGNYDAWQWDIHKRAVAYFSRWADSVLFAKHKNFIKSEEAGFNRKTKRALSTGKRVICTQERPGHPGGGRNVYGELPYELPLEWSEFQNAVTAALAAKNPPAEPAKAQPEDVEASVPFTS